MKKCGKCGNVYPSTLSYFHKNQYRPDRLTVMCVDCLGIRFKEFTDETPLRLANNDNISDELAEKYLEIINSLTNRNILPTQKTMG